ncbi:hypothetical protein [Kitasatospora cineracea]|uniref:hypothetical protein n=1 Tax=Kitasatospora cineracea TaxID=88074 RepID=UPI0038262A02
MTVTTRPATSTVVGLGPDGDCSALTGAAGPVLVAAPASRLDFDTLERLALAGVRSNRAFGVLPTDLDRGGTPFTPDGHWYRAGHRALGLGAGDDPADALAALDRSWALLSVFGHGDGMHINMDGVVLCGVTGEHEDLDGTPVPGGCSAAADHCKKQSVLPDIRRAQDLRCQVLLLLSCNSLALSEQLYPSDNSIAVAAWRAGAAQAVIGTTRQTEFTAQEAEAAGRRLLDGTPIGEVVRELNAARLAVGRAGWYVLLGDPLLTLPSATTPDRLPQPAPTGADPAPETGRVPARELLARLTDGRRLATALRVVGRAASSPDADAALRRLEALRYSLEQRTWAAVAHQHLTAAVPAATHRRLVSAATAWQDACRAALETTGLLSAAPGGDVGDRLTRALALFADPAAQTPSDTVCDRCRGRVLVQPLSFPDAAPGAGPARAALECAGCGPRGNVLLPGADPVSGRLPELTVAGFPTVRKGTEAEFRLRCPTVGAITDVALVLQVRDKSRPTPLPERWYRLPPDRDEHRVGFPIPEDSGSDIFSARAVLLRDGSVEILRCVFPVH